MPDDALIAGILCSEVLAHLSDFIDGALPPARVRALENHLEGCSHCARFGAEFSDAIGRLRAQARDNELDADIEARLLARLEED